ncbi:ribonuclease HII [Bacteroidales bacterium OttesenSCG-928-C03]|nr:ribonuclease HII [Bacteroidales bacterium OttesenSCG-928-E04]MDL2309069.1 ribonuclease HII [Bacteroidales bacterium OttesenSCG-928-C03]MDL2326821.1 ribonuclease HII [Bacteroidales bacterium OttesenSCG-928-A14]
MPLKSRYSEQYIIECGVDEAGRGAIAGPLYAAAVILPENYENDLIDDSKKLTRDQRNKLREIIEREALAYCVVAVSEVVIDEINVLNATFLGMNNAVKGLDVQPELLLIDGNRFRNSTNIPYQCCVKGDANYLSIAAASILAKTYRDDFMDDIDREFPQYEWRKNKGYPTASHQQTVIQQGRCIYHRKSFQLKSQLKLDFGE